MKCREMIKFVFLSVFELTHTPHKNPFSAPTSAPPGCTVVLSIPSYQKANETDSYSKTTRHDLISNLFSLIGRFGR